MKNDNYGSSHASLADIQSQTLHRNDNRGPAFIIVATFFIAASTSAVILRLVARRIIKRALDVDDFAIVIALTLAAAAYIAAVLSVHFGLGKHVRVLKPDDIVHLLATYWAFQVIWVFCHVAIKTSILLLYKNAFTLLDRRFRIAWYTIACYIIIWATVDFFLTIFQCQPAQYYWLRPHEDVQGHCRINNDHYIGAGIPNTICDFVLLLLPMPLVWNLQMPRKSKAALSGIFLLGGIACIASILRVYFMAVVDYATDISYLAFEPKIWSLIEPCTGIVCACLTTLRPLFRAFHQTTKQGITNQLDRGQDTKYRHIDRSSSRDSVQTMSEIHGCGTKESV